MAIPTEMYFVSNASPTGNDGNDGFDVLALGSTGDTWTHATLTLTSTGHGLSPSAGEIMYISSANAGNAGWYTVASNDSNDIVMTALVAGVDIGSDQTDIATSTGALLTIDAGCNKIDAVGNKLWMKGGTSYTERADIDTAGTSIAPMVFEGYTTIPGDGGRITIDGSGSNSYGIGQTITSGQAYLVVKNVRVTNSSGTASVAVYSVSIPWAGHLGTSDRCRKFGVLPAPTPSPPAV